MKLLFIQTNIGYGGASKMIVWVANQFAENGYDVTFLTFRDKKICQVLSPRIHLVQEELEGINGTTKVFSTILWLHKFLKKGNFDFAIAFLSPSQLRLAIASIGTKTKLIFSHRGDPSRPSKGLKNRLVNIINYRTFALADYFVFQTNQAMNCYNTRIQNKSIVIPNPINPLKRTVCREGNIQKKIVSVGRLDIKQKRQDLLIYAFNKIYSDYPEYELIFYGDGEDYSKLQEIAGNNHRIHFLGKTNNVAEAIQNAAIFVLSSDFEGIPNALLEAMSLGLPCISTDCSPGGAALLIKDRENGLLTKRGDVNGLAKAISYYLDNPQIAENNGKEAMKVVQTYSEKRITTMWINFLEGIGK